jgi:hypothetical protein
MFCALLSDVPLKLTVSTSEENCDPAEELEMSMTHRDNYPLRQCLVDEPDPDLTHILHLIKHQNRPLRDPEFMDQKSIVLYLNRKGWTAQVIHDDLVARLGEEAIAYRTMMKYLRERRSMIRSKQFSEPLKNSHSLQLDGFYVQYISQKPREIQSIL